LDGTTSEELKGFSCDLIRNLIDPKSLPDFKEWAEFEAFLMPELAKLHKAEDCYTLQRRKPLKEKFTD
jgi:hypothetical protein